MNLIQRSRSFKIGQVFFLAFLLCSIAAQAAITELPRVKVNKDKITVFPPDENGQVWIHGEAGAIDSTSEVTAELANITSRDKKSVEVKEDGSFEAIIRAAAKDKVRITARNRQRMRSIGTFDVPDTLSNNDKLSKLMDSLQKNKPSLENQAPAAPAAPATPATPATTPAPQNQVNLAIMITVVDIATGRILAVDRITGAAQTKTGQDDLLPKLGQNLIAKCFETISKELKNPRSAPPTRLEPSGKGTSVPSAACPAKNPAARPLCEPNQPGQTQPCPAQPIGDQK